MMAGFGFYTARDPLVLTHGFYPPTRSAAGKRQEAPGTRQRRRHGLPRGALAISEDRTRAAAYAARGLGFAPAAARELSRAILAPVRARSASRSSRVYRCSLLLLGNQALQAQSEAT